MWPKDTDRYANCSPAQYQIETPWTARHMIYSQASVLWPLCVVWLEWRGIHGKGGRRARDEQTPPAWRLSLICAACIVQNCMTLLPLSDYQGRNAWSQSYEHFWRLELGRPLHAWYSKHVWMGRQSCPSHVTCVGCRQPAATSRCGMKCIQLSRYEMSPAFGHTSPTDDIVSR